MIILDQELVESACLTGLCQVIQGIVAVFLGNREIQSVAKSGTEEPRLYGQRQRSVGTRKDGVALYRELVSLALQLLNVDRVISRERRTREVIENIRDILIAEILPAGIDLDLVIFCKLVYRLVYLGLNVSGEFEVGVQLVRLMTDKR